MRRLNSAASVRMRCRVSRERSVPFALGALTARLRVPRIVDRLRDYERRRWLHAECCACRRDFALAERGAVRVRGSGLRRCALADDRLAADERGPVGSALRSGDRGTDRSTSWPSTCAHDMPAVRLEALRRVVGEPAGGRAVDGDAVVVVEHDELAERQRAGERARLVRDAFHQAAVADEHVRVVIDDRVPGAIELRGKQPLRRAPCRRALARPWPSGPVVVSTPGVTPTSGWPGVFECSWRKLRQLLEGRS